MKTPGRRPLTIKVSVTGESRVGHPTAAGEGKVTSPPLFFPKIHDPSLIAKKKHQTNSNARTFHKLPILFHNLDVTENKVRTRNCHDQDTLTK